MGIRGGIIKKQREYPRRAKLRINSQKEVGSLSSGKGISSIRRNGKFSGTMETEIMCASVWWGGGGIGN